MKKMYLFEKQNDGIGGGIFHPEICNPNGPNSQGRYRLKTGARNPNVGAGAQVLVPPSTAFPGPLAGKAAWETGTQSH